MAAGALPRSRLLDRQPVRPMHLYETHLPVNSTEASSKFYVDLVKGFLFASTISTAVIAVAFASLNVTDRYGPLAPVFNLFQRKSFQCFSFAH